VAENYFGILSAVFWVLRKQIDSKPSKATSITYACIHLHKFLRHNYGSCQKYFPPGTLDYKDTNWGCIIFSCWWNEPFPFTPMQPARGRTTKEESHLISTFWLQEQCHGKQTFVNYLLCQVVLKLRVYLTNAYFCILLMFPLVSRTSAMHSWTA
jgi:hypothetical protein